MKNTIGFIKPNYPGERRVAILPEDIVNLENGSLLKKGLDQRWILGMKTIDKREQK
ncbi:MAG: hypothetical protein H6688_00995 [Erysipelotrichaceae bacterium]|nr:hypothetical protein [Erysipelotrichaceae bacterium]